MRENRTSRLSERNPRTRWLILDGAWNEGAFKRHIRNRQIVTQVWYAAYPNLSAIKIAENARLRAGLSARRGEGPTKDWLRLLRRDWTRPPAEPVRLEREDMQGLLVRGHSHHEAACFFLLTFAGRAAGRAAAKGWLGELLADRDVMMDGSPERCPLYAHVAFTPRGLERLGCPASLLAGFSDEFRFGMTTEHRRRLLGDDGASAPELWDWGGPGAEPDAALLLYARTERELASLSDRQRKRFARYGIREKLLETTWFVNKKEHFGFHDGITTPIIDGLGRQADPGLRIKPGEFILGYRNEYGRYTASPLVHRALDPAGCLKLDIHGSGAADFGRNGAYLVFRQLRQDVHGFWACIDQASHARGGAARRERLAAKMVGRWPSGAPLALAPDEDDPALADADDFRFHDDPHGHRCPIGAHIRRTTPATPSALGPGARRRSPGAGGTGSAASGRLRAAACGVDRPRGRSGQGGRRPGAGPPFHLPCRQHRPPVRVRSGKLGNNPQFETLHDDVDPLIGRRGRFAAGNGRMSRPRTSPFPAIPCARESAACPTLRPCAAARISSCRACPGSVTSPTAPDRRSQAPCSPGG